MRAAKVAVKKVSETPAGESVSIRAVSKASTTITTNSDRFGNPYTGTTIVTFLMAFLVQNAKNRDARAIPLKLNELIHAVALRCC